MALDTPRLLLDGLRFAECPRWHDGRLWFTDFLAQRVIAVDEQGRSEVMAEFEQEPSGIGFLPDGRLLAVLLEARLLLRVDGPGKTTTVADLNALGRGLIPDMIVDRRGNAYLPSAGFDPLKGEQRVPGTILLVTPDGRARVAAEGLGYGNGPAITRDGKTLIFAESFARRVSTWPIAPDGSLGERHTFAEFTERTPDGIAVDSEGAIWMADAARGTGGFLRLRDGGEITDRVVIPERGSIACALGGADGRTLFLITSVGNLRERATSAQIHVTHVPVPA